MLIRTVSNVIGNGLHPMRAFSRQAQHLDLDELQARLNNGPNTVIPRCLYSIGERLHEKGEYQMAASYFEQAIWAHRQIYGNRAKFYVSFVLTNLQKTWLAQGKWDKFQACGNEKKVLEQRYSAKLAGPGELRTQR